MTPPLDVEGLRRVADRLAGLGCKPEAEELVRELSEAELGWLAEEFERRADAMRDKAEALDVSGGLVLGVLEERKP